MDAETWLSLAEVANLLGIGLRAIQKNCSAGKYTTRKAKATKGGGNGGEVYEILLNSLPAKHVKEYLNRNSKAHEAGEVDATKTMLSAELLRTQDRVSAMEGHKAYLGLSGKAKSRADAKTDVLDALARFSKAGKGDMSDFVIAFRKGEIEGIDEARETLGGDVSIPSLYRWQRAIRKEGAAALAGRYGHRKGSGLIDTQPELREYIHAFITGQQSSVKNLHDGIKARFSGREGVEIPSERTLDRYVAEWKRQNSELAMALANPDAWKGQYMVAFGDAAAHVDRLNQVWEMDSTPADVMLTDGRHSIIGVLDIYSRRFKLLVTPTSKAAAVALLIRRGILAWGVPETIKTDRGTDYVSHHITRVLRFLEIEQDICPPFQPWRKPHIERAFRTFSHGPIEMMPGYIGHNVAERDAIRNRQSFADRLMTKNEVVEIKLDAAALQAYCDQWCETVYYRSPHEGLGGETPQARVLHYDGPIRTISDVRALDLLLAEAPGDGYRVVGKKGLRIDNDHYIAPELEAWVNRRVHVLYDPADLGRVYVYGDEDGKTKFVCVAECPDRTGIDRAAVATKAREMQKDRIQQGRAELKKLSKKVKIEDALDEIHAAAAQADNVITLFPRASENHTTAALDAAREASEAAGIRPLDDFSPAEIIELKQKIDEKVASGIRREEPDFDSMYQRAQWLWERLIQDNEAPMNGEQEEFIRNYRMVEPKSWRSLDDLLKAKWGARYLDIRDRALGLKK